MLPDTLLKQITDLAETYAKAHTCRNLARLSDTDPERAHLNARADFWDAQVSDRYVTLTVALNSAIPPTVYAAPDQTGCVRITAEGQIEVRGDLDNGARAVSIRLTTPQAVTAGAAMIACAAACAKHTGERLAEILPPIPPSPPGPVSRPS